MIPDPARGTTALITFQQRLKAHIDIARIDHWTKNVFVLPGVLIPFTFQPVFSEAFFYRVVLGMLAVCLIASSNYVINEILDAPFDRLHPVKNTRPAAIGLVHLPSGYVQWLVLMAFGMTLALYVSKAFAITVFALWVMGCIYNLNYARKSLRRRLFVGAA